MRYYIFEKVILQDKTSILLNSVASESFNDFVTHLGWMVRIGKRHYGYNGGLPTGAIAPYYATADNEIVFHVSTMLDG